LRKTLVDQLRKFTPLEIFLQTTLWGLETKPKQFPICKIFFLMAGNTLAGKKKIMAVGACKNQCFQPKGVADY